MSNITIKRVSDTSAELYWNNGAYLGYVYIEVDGYYVFITTESRGSWASYALREVADVLDSLNKDWDEKVKSINHEQATTQENQS